MFAEANSFTNADYRHTPFEILLLNDANMIGEHKNTFVFGRTLGNKNENARKDIF